MLDPQDHLSTADIADYLRGDLPPQRATAAELTQAGSTLVYGISELQHSHVQLRCGFGGHSAS